MPDVDEFWKQSRRRVAREAAVTVDAAGFEVSPLSVLELINSAPLATHQIDTARFREGYLFHCLKQTQSRIDAGYRRLQLKLNRAVDFWLREFPDLAPQTQSCILFEVRTRLEPAASDDRECDLLHQVLPPELRGLGDWDFF